VNVKEIMTTEPATCTPDTSLEEVAKLLVKYDCGAIPVMRSREALKPVGIVTDRDIVCRVIATGRDAAALTAQDCMSTPCVTIAPTASLDACCEKMEQYLIRRLVVVDTEGFCLGVVSQADIARRMVTKAGEVVKEVSRPSRSASAVKPVEAASPSH
jgi:CBS domain-containing protein